jgi:hypothetical protein
VRPYQGRREIPSAWWWPSGCTERKKAELLLRRERAFFAILEGTYGVIPLENRKVPYVTAVHADNRASLDIPTGKDWFRKAIRMSRTGERPSGA